MESYQGNEPYIFVSYSHKDQQEVEKIIIELKKRGYRIWYDEGIEPGSEWPEFVAKRLNDSTIVLAFISNAAVSSTNCKNEINFAIQKDKQFLWILLEKTEMTLGLELQLSSQQCIIKYQYPTIEEFCDKVTSVSMLNCCKEEKVEVAPKQEETPVPVVETPTPAKEETKVEPVKPVTKPAKTKKKVKIDLYMIIGILFFPVDFMIASLSGQVAFYILVASILLTALARFFIFKKIGIRRWCAFIPFFATYLTFKYADCKKNYLYTMVCFLIGCAFFYGTIKASKMIVLSIFLFILSMFFMIVAACFKFKQCMQFTTKFNAPAGFSYILFFESFLGQLILAFNPKYKYQRELF